MKDSFVIKNQTPKTNSIDYISVKLFVLVRYEI